MRIPEKLKFQGREVKVSLCEKREILGNEGASGWSNGEIRINQELDAGLKGRVFMEELVHHALDELGQYDICRDEKVVQGLATILYATLNDNGLLVDVNANIPETPAD